MQIVNGRIWPMDGPIIENGYVMVEAGRIAGVGPMTAAPADDQRVDAGGRLVLPGLVDAHCHLGLFGDGLGEEGEDGDEEL